ncbi:PAS domain S-box protein [bacterium]|nr:MAG: PAS domain S-box protein [bacterium]
MFVYVNIRLNSSRFPVIFEKRKTGTRNFRLSNVEPMGLVKRFLLIIFGTVLVFGIVLGYALTHFIEKSHLERTTRTYVAIVEEGALFAFTKADFSPSLSAEQKAAVRAKLASFYFGPDTVSRKVWSTDHEVLWASEEKLVGSRFLDDPELDEALSGKVASNYTDLLKSENRLDPKGQRLLEIYVPVSFGKGEKPDVVFEVYSDVAPLVRDMAAMRKILWAGNIAGIVLLIVALTPMFVRASRRIENQRVKIERSEARFRNLLKFANDGIIAMDQSRNIVIFNRTAEKLFGLTESEALGRKFDDLVSKPSRPDFLGVVEHLKKSKSQKGLVMACSGMRSNGIIFPIVLSLSTSEEDDEGLMLAIVADAAERQKLGV